MAVKEPDKILSPRVLLLIGALTCGLAYADQAPSAVAPAADSRALADTAQPMPARPPVAGHSAGRSAARHANGSGLEERVHELTQALELDVAQQQALRKVLTDQREQTLRVWNDSSSVPAAFRIAALKAITDHTADQIRALLNDEQRKKYNPPRRPSQDAEPRPDVGAWMDAISGHAAAPAATR
jgi:hypothetical protein